MAPQSVVAPSPDEAILEQRKAPAAAPPPVRPSDPQSGPHRHELFDEALLEMSDTRPPRRTLDFVVSVFVHGTVLATLILLPLFFTDTIDLKQFTSTLLVAPPPPPPPPPPPAAIMARVSAEPRRVFTSAGKLLAPVAVPERVAMLKEEALPPEVGTYGVVGGVPGGVPGGQIGGVIGGIIGGIGTSAHLPPPPAKVAKVPLRVGGRVREPKALATPQPVYPALARTAKVQGDVVIDAVIDATGRVSEMRLVSGHPLLVQAAMNVLQMWRYEPTYLNDEPTPVALLVTIRFRLE